MPEMLNNEIKIGSGAITANVLKTLEVLQCRKIFLKPHFENSHLHRVELLSPV